MTTLKLWVANQYSVCQIDTDCTENFIRATHWTPPAGVTLDCERCTLTGESAAVHAAAESLTEAVADVGWGTEEIDEAAPERPGLTVVAAYDATEVGVRVGQAIARDVIADDMPREWTGLDAQDGDQLTAAGIEPGSPQWDEAEAAAETAYYAAIAAAAR